MQRRLDDGLAGRPVPDDFAPGVWATWNAKPARAMCDDALIERRRVGRAAGGVSDEDLAGLPRQLSAPDDPRRPRHGRAAAQRAHLPQLGHRRGPGPVRHPGPGRGGALVIDNLGLAASFSARPTGSDRIVTVRTTEPDRSFTITLTPDAVTFAPGDGGRAAGPDAARRGLRSPGVRAPRPRPHARVRGRPRPARRAAAGLPRLLTVPAPAVEVVVLGSGTPRPDPGRAGSALAVVAGRDWLLVDCGRAATQRAIDAGLDLTALVAVALTHHHSDHVSDLATLATTRWTAGAATPLAVVAPAGPAARFASRCLDPYEEQRSTRSRPKTPAPGRGWRSTRSTRRPVSRPSTRRMAGASRRVLVDHHPVAPAVGYLVERDGARVAVSGDTAVCDGMRALARDVDVLVHETLHPALVPRRPPGLERRRRRRGRTGGRRVPRHAGPHPPAPRARRPRTTSGRTSTRSAAAATTAPPSSPPT